MCWKNLLFYLPESVQADMLTIKIATVLKEEGEKFLQETDVLNQCSHMRYLMTMEYGIVFLNTIIFMCALQYGL